MLTRYKKLLLLLLTFTACTTPSILSNKTASDKQWHSYSPAPYPYSDYTVSSNYLTMSDGVKIAIDLYLPASLEQEKKIPTIVWQTRYYRSWEGRLPFGLFVSGPHSITEGFIKSGYAVVATDVRGSGASFGTQTNPWSKDEVRDGSEIVDWIIKQPWSDGQVGAMGVSYVGTTAEMLLTTKHPAIKAIAPRFALFDCYSDIAFPGGIYHSWFMKNWGEGNKVLDEGTLNLGLLGSILARGVSPVDNDRDRSLLKTAQQLHQQNTDVYQATKNISYRDDALVGGLQFEQFCPVGFIDELRKTAVPIYSYSGWFDGAYASSAINRFKTVRNPGSRLILGPWDHGGVQNISESSPNRESAFDHGAELLRFFNYYLKKESSGIQNEDPVWYFTMGEERWKSAPDWPPAGFSTKSFFLSDNHLLAENAGHSPTNDLSTASYQVDFSAGTGNTARWNSPYNPNKNPIQYLDRAEADKKLLVYETAPLPCDTEVTGEPELSLSFSSSSNYAKIFVYLESSADKIRYLSEGLSDALHRKNSPDQSFLRKDALPIVPNEKMNLSIRLLPVSYRFHAGERIRLAIGGADKDHFYFENPAQTVYQIQAGESFIKLPIKEFCP